MSSSEKASVSTNFVFSMTTPQSDYQTVQRLHLRKLLERRFQAAREQGDQTLIHLLNLERERLFPNG
jgi:hypothetical protein